MLSPLLLSIFRLQHQGLTRNWWWDWWCWKRKKESGSRAQNAYGLNFGKSSGTRHVRMRMRVRACENRRIVLRARELEQRFGATDFETIRLAMGNMRHVWDMWHVVSDQWGRTIERLLRGWSWPLSEDGFSFQFAKLARVCAAVGNCPYSTATGSKIKRILDYLKCVVWKNINRLKLKHLHTRFIGSNFKSWY